MNDDPGILRTRRFESALDQCVAFAARANPGQIGLVLGPSGAGKSILSKCVGRVSFGDSSIWQPGTIPYVRVVAENPDRGYFSPRDLTRSILLELRDPFHATPAQIEGWSLEQKYKARLIEAAAEIKNRRISEPDMRSVIVAIAPHVKLRLIIIDEGNMLSLTYRNRTPTDYLEGIRVMAQKAGCAVLIFGTVDMLYLRGFSAQLNRSIVHIHLDRMHRDCSDDEEDFLAYLIEVEEKRGMPTHFLAKSADDIHQWTYGIPGEVEALLDRATIRAPGKNGAIDWSDISASRQCGEVMQQIKLEADTIFKVINHIPLTQAETKAATSRSFGKMKPRKLKVGQTA